MLRSDSVRLALAGQILAANREWLDRAIAALDLLGDSPRAEKRPTTKTNGGRMAVVGIVGFIDHHESRLLDLLGGTSSEAIARQVDELADDSSIGKIVLRVDSGGGSVAGIVEASDAIYRARKRKPVVAVIDSTAGSAAYWLTAQASEIAITPSGDAGSLGVYAAHVSYAGANQRDGIEVNYITSSREKIELSPHLTLSSEARAAQQKQIDEFYRQFVAHVARGRGLTTSQVEANFGRGRMLLAADAKSRGMVDRITSFADVLKESGVTSGRGHNRIGALAAAGDRLSVERAQCILASLE